MFLFNCHSTTTTSCKFHHVTVYTLCYSMIMNNFVYTHVIVIHVQFLGKNKLSVSVQHLRDAWNSSCLIEVTAAACLSNAWQANKLEGQ